MSIRIRKFKLSDTKDAGAHDYMYALDNGPYQGPEILGAWVTLNTAAIQSLKIQIRDAGGTVLLYSLLHLDNQSNLEAGFFRNSPPDVACGASQQPAIPVAGFTYDDDVSAPTPGSTYEVSAPTQPPVSAPMGQAVNINKQIGQMLVKSKKMTNAGNLTVVRQTVSAFTPVAGTSNHDVSINTSP